MRNLSKFVHVFDLGEHVALWHSLRMKPVFLSHETYDRLLQGECDKNLEPELLRKRILLSHESEDEEVLQRFRENSPKPDVNLAYFILSERCNLACKYCFVGSDTCGKGISSVKDMSLDVAEKAIDVFARQLEQSDCDYTKNESNIIFFGGEPLLKFDVLKYVVQRIKEISKTRPVLRNTNTAIITNGTLLNEDKITALNDMGVAVSISIDGFTKEANAMRVDNAGVETFERVLHILEIYKKLNVDAPSLSVTLTKKTIEDLPSMVDLVRNFNVQGFGYNVLLKRDNSQDDIEYYEAASDFIIDSFLALRKHGVYEDRIMRKLNAFANSKIHYSDCGATSGGQILFAPDGRIGICQGLMANSENYVANVWDENFIASKHDAWKNWSRLIPIYNDECLSCEALGICGGGCPVNAKATDPKHRMNCVDKRSCIHSKKTLRFLIEDLYRLALENSIKDA